MFLSNGKPVPDGIVGAFAESTPLLYGGTHYPNTALQLAGRTASYGQMYRSQLWVYVVCRKVGVSTARVPIRVRQKTAAGYQDAPGTPYARFLARPSKVLDEFSLWLWTATTEEIYGEALWLKLRNADGTVGGVAPMHPINVALRRDADGTVEYLLTQGSPSAPIITPIPSADVVHFKNYNPDDPTRGLSMLEPLRQTLANEDAVRRASFSFWDRGARPSMVLKHPGTLSDDAAKRLKANWDALHGGADRMGGTAVLEEGLDAVAMQLSAEEMQYIQSRKLNREEVCAAADIPPPVIHILDQATYSNITEQMRSMYRDTMTPRLRGFESTLDLQLRPDFDPGNELVAEFALDDVLRGDFETRSQTVIGLVGGAVAKPAEGREMLGLPDTGPDADKLYGDARLVPLGTTERLLPAGGGEEGQPIPRPKPVQDEQVAQPGRQLQPVPPAPVRRGGRPPKQGASNG